MPTPRVRLALFVGVAALLLSACEMSVRIGTRVDAGGRGAFTVAIGLDRELLDGLRRSDAGGLATIEALFGRLGAQGWKTQRDETPQGATFSAEREFADEAGFEAALRELGAPPAGDAAASGGPFTLDYRSERSFFKIRNRFAGEIDTTGFLGDLDEQNRRLLDQLRDEIARVVRFEVSAALPGAVSVVEGDGTVAEGVAVWRPSFGSTMRFAATSSAIRVSSLLFVAAPVVLLLAGALVWLGTRRKALIVEAPTPHRPRARRRIALDEPPVVLDRPHVEIDLTETSFPTASGVASPNGEDLRTPERADPL